MGGLRLWLFGSPHAEVNGHEVALNLRPRTLPVLAYILLSPQRTADTRAVASRLWPDELDEDGLANLRRHLYYLRQWFATVGVDAEGIQRKGRNVTISAQAVEWVDVLEFERLAQTNDPPSALDLYTGELLEGVADDWVEARRETLLETFMRVSERTTEELLSIDPGRAAATAQRMLTLDRFRESAVRGLMRALDAGGDRAGSLREYQRFARALRDELAADPSDLTVQLAESLSSSIAPSRYTLPRSLSSFVGRKPAREELARMCGGSRLVTITGTAGVGKTRLACEVARDAENRFADGVRFIDLSSLNDEREVARALQSALVPADDAIAGDDRTLESAIRDRAYLIVFDSCEHLGDAAGQSAQRILQASSGSHILATSRVPLRVQGEVTWRLDPLEVSTEAAELFIDRARAARPSINPNRFSQADVQRICGHVDGLPLAIEIAAARLRTMTLREVADQLARRLGAMAQALQWSIELLSEHERTVFYRLSVFRDGFTAESAAAVCESDVSETVATLVENSLVVPPDPDAPEERYRILESIRQPAFEALKESGDAQVAQCLHAGHFASRFIELDEDLRHARSSLYFTVLEREYQNVSAALDWLIAQGHDVESGMKLTLALSRHWFDRGMIGEARVWMERALQGDADPLLSARVAQCLATVSRNTGDYAESFALVAESVARLKAGGADAVTLGKAVAVQSNAARILGDFETARKLGYDAIALFEPARDVYLTAFARTCIAVTLYGEGRLEEAEREFAQILDEFEKCGAENDRVLTMANLAICRLYAGDYAVARARFNAALPRAIAIGHRYCEAWTRLGLTMTHALMEQGDEAVDELLRAAALAKAIDDKELQIGCVETAAICLLKSTPERAAQAMGCAARARERYHAPRLPVEEPLYERISEELSDAMSPAALAIALEEGRFTSLGAWLGLTRDDFETPRIVR